MKYFMIMFAVFTLSGCYGQGGHVIPMADGISLYSVYENNPEAVGISQAMSHVQVCAAPSMLPADAEIAREDLTGCNPPKSYPSSGSGVVESIGGPALAGGAIGAGLAYSGDDVRSSQHASQSNDQRIHSSSHKKRK